MQSNKNSHSLLVTMPTGRATLENNLGVSYQVKHTLPAQYVTQ